jgi:putative proteasome-type protease
MFQLSWLRLWSARKSSRARKRQRPSWILEVLDDRLLLSALTPAQVSHAYGVDQIMFGSIKGDGTGQTIAIIDAYDAPNIISDLAAFDAAFGIQNVDGKGAAVVTKATPQGTPAYNANWAEEITLDVEWAHAMAPGAHILLVEASSNSLTGLLGAVDYARNQAGVSVVSMSWGAGEFSSETSYDSYFTTPTGHAGVTFIASSGDVGGVTEWPAVSPNVVSIGGTSLFTDALGNYSSESAWGGSGGGISAYESKPGFQSTVTQSSTKRTGPDVSWVADPGTGVYIVFNGGMTVVGGTSAGAPQWAGLVAIADTRVTSGAECITARKVSVHTQGQHSLFLMTSGLRSVRDKVVTYFEDVLESGDTEFDRLYKAVNALAEQVRRVAAEDKEALEAANLRFNLYALIGGQMKHDREHKLYLLYPQANWVEVGPGTPYSIIGETGYGKPILDRTLKYSDSMPFALKVGCLAFDSTRISAANVDFPIDIVVYRRDSFEIIEHLIFFRRLQLRGLRFSISRPLLERLSVPRPSSARRAPR